jgi:hypothetical protein
MTKMVMMTTMMKVMIDTAKKALSKTIPAFIYVIQHGSLYILYNPGFSKCDMADSQFPVSLFV